MIEKILTESGSVYTIDWDNKTWLRESPEGVNKLRTDRGEFIEIETKVLLGNKTPSLVMQCPPINPPIPRFIYSTPIVSRVTI